MFCNVENKEVSITPIQEVRVRGNVAKTFYDCTGNYVEVAGMRLRRTCPGSQSEDCLLKRK